MNLPSGDFIWIAGCCALIPSHRAYPSSFVSLYQSLWLVFHSKMTAIVQGIQVMPVQVERTWVKYREIRHVVVREKVLELRTMAGVEDVERLIRKSL